ncbi:hypothetical protein ACJIZ3_019747 [Penstemon smallii]|uniref:Uncharacterized protein n=1 Tax=Penstemon smallii TaxID=265156 RepID=A0ABD3T233_9LAMI
MVVSSPVAAPPSSLNRLRELGFLFCRPPYCYGFIFLRVYVKDVRFDIGLGMKRMKLLESSIILSIYVFFLLGSCCSTSIKQTNMTGWVRLHQMDGIAHFFRRSPAVDLLRKLTQLHFLPGTTVMLKPLIGANVTYRFT